MSMGNDHTSTGFRERPASAERPPRRLLLLAAVLAGLALSLTCFAGAASAETEIVLPKGATLNLSLVNFDACNSLVYGYEVDAGPNVPLGEEPGTCGPVGEPEANVGPFAAEHHIRLYIEDRSCHFLFYSGGDHSKVTGSGPLLVELFDAGFGCPFPPGEEPGEAPPANLEATVTLAPVITGAASEVTASDAVLNASVNPQGQAVKECVFEYGETTAYGSTVSCSPAPGSGTKPVSVSAAIGGLHPETPYHFRVSTTNIHGVTVGSDQTLTTLHLSDTGEATEPTATAKASVGELSVEATGGIGKITIGPYGGKQIGGQPLAMSSGPYFQVFRSSSSTFTKVKYEDCELGGAKTLWWDDPATGWEPISEPAAVYTASEGHECVTVTATEHTTPSVAELSDPRHVGGPSAVQEFGKCEPQKHGRYEDTGCSKEKFKESKTGAKEYKGKYEWHPSPVGCIALKHGRFSDPGCSKLDVNKKRKPKGSYELAQQTYTASGAGASLEATGLPTLECTASSSQGVIQEPNHGEDTITFSGCKQQDAGPCESAGTPAGTIVTEFLETYTYEEKGNIEALAGAPFMEYACGSERFTVLGAIAGPLTMAADEMTTAGQLAFSEVIGGQTIEVLDGHGQPHQAYLTSMLTTTSSQPIELRTTK